MNTVERALSVLGLVGVALFAANLVTGGDWPPLWVGLVVSPAGSVGSMTLFWLRQVRARRDAGSATPGA